MFRAGGSRMVVLHGQPQDIANERSQAMAELPRLNSYRA
jgi:hypothetical protein